MWNKLVANTLCCFLLASSVFQCSAFQPFTPGQFDKSSDISARNFERQVSTLGADEAPGPVTLDQYKEESRKYRRTVFGFEDWKRHRESARHFRNLKTIFSSGVIRGLRNEVLAVTSVACFVVFYNDVIASGVAGDYLGIDLPAAKLKLNSLPFTISSSALGLLLVFRTNAAYSRWKDARIQWGGTINRSLDICRAGLAYFGQKEGYPKTQEMADLKKELVLRTVCFARCLKAHFRDGEDEQVKLRKELTELLSAEEAERIMEAKHRPLRAVQDLSDVLRRGKLSDMQLQILDKSVAFFCDSIGVCERIFKTPIPLVYTRHTSRFLTTWLLMLPFALYNDKGSEIEQLATIPEAALIAMFFYGIEELGIQIEEPFSILPMEAMSDGIERNCKEMLYNDLGQNGYFDDTELCKSNWC